ncbi:MAG: serine hydrolase [Phycisphaerae bacterium]|nr:serine hydrolase [Saprospiraceae bacterium]
MKLINGEILSSTNLTAMTTDPDNEEEYAYGWNTNPNDFFKQGDIDGARAHIRCYPNKKIVIALLCNTRGDSEHNLGVLSREIGDLLVK